MMEIRRIQITGGSSYMITLPKSWAESVGLKKNDPVAVISRPDGSLLLTVNGDTNQNQSCKELDVDGFDSPDALYRCLIGAYIAGHDQILLESKDPIKGSFLEAISEFTQTSMGMEIVEEDEEKILIKDLIDHSEVIPHKNVRREYLLVKRMIADAVSTDPPEMSEMVSRDTEVDRIHWLVQRQASIHQKDVSLSMKMGLRLGTVLSCMGISKILERMGDHAVLIVKNRMSSDADRCNILNHGLVELGKDLQDYIEKSMESWFDADNVLAEQVICRKELILRKLEDSLGEIVDTSSGSMLYGSFVRLVEYCTDIAESAIDVAMENE